MLIGVADALSPAQVDDLHRVSLTELDIVRLLMHRYIQYSNSQPNTIKKFEEGIFSDLRRLAPPHDCVLEPTRSDFLSFLYEHDCVRSKKKQKVFFWTSFYQWNDTLLCDAFEREMARIHLSRSAPFANEASDDYPSVERIQTARMDMSSHVNNGIRVPLQERRRGLGEWMVEEREMEKLEAELDSRITLGQKRAPGSPGHLIGLTLTSEETSGSASAMESTSERDDAMVRSFSPLSRAVHALSKKRKSVPKSVVALKLRKEQNSHLVINENEDGWLWSDDDYDENLLITAKPPPPNPQDSLYYVPPTELMPSGYYYYYCYQNSGGDSSQKQNVDSLVTLSTTAVERKQIIEWTENASSPTSSTFSDVQQSTSFSLKRKLSEDDRGYNSAPESDTNSPSPKKHTTTHSRALLSSRPAEVKHRGWGHTVGNMVEAAFILLGISRA